MKIVKHITYEPDYIAIKLITNDGLGIIQYSYNKSEDYVFIYSFSVENNNRGKHIGTNLFEYCLTEINNLNKEYNNLKFIHLIVDKHNTRLINFYKKYKFKITNYNYDEYYVYMERIL